MLKCGYFVRFTSIFWYCKLMLIRFMKKQSKKNNKLPNILTLRQACDILNCHPNTLRNWDNKGILKAIRFGKRGDRRYRKEDVLKIIKKK